MTDSTQSYAVTGLTCGHCVSAVIEEVATIPGVSNVSVELVAGGTSTMTVAADHALDDDVVTAALDEAGDYRLVP